MLNILQIVCHDLGRFLGCSGVRTVYTPALDQLASEGVLFANSFCTSPGCSPSRAALATGRYPHSNGCMGLAHAHFGWELAPGERHVASLLAEAGYQTALFGIQHVTYHLETLGFQHAELDRPADQVAENVAAYLRQCDRGRPFYLEVNFFEPHRPFDFGGVPPDTERGYTIPPWLPNSEGSHVEIAAFQGAVRKADAAAGQILAALDATGRAADTLALFTSDHGIAFPRAKGTLFDAGIEAALLVRWPTAVPAGQVRDELVSNVDVLPTYLEAASVPLPPTLQGHSFLPLMRSGDAGDYAPREAIFAEKTYHEHYDPQRCIRTSRHKLIHHFEVSNAAYVPTDIAGGASYPAAIRELAARPAMLELYDLQEDPWEQRNLAADPDHAPQVRDLGCRLRDWMRETDDPLLRGPVASPFAANALQQLESY